MTQTIAEIMTHHAHMSPYQFQRWVFKQALKAGWTGSEPSVLGHGCAEMRFNEALRFLQSKQIKADLATAGLTACEIATMKESLVAAFADADARKQDV